jgi:hypothetical protein
MDLMLLMAVLMAARWIPSRQEDSVDFCPVRDSNRAAV